MEDGPCTRRGTPTICETYKQGLSWPAADIQHQSNSSFVSGCGTNSSTGALQRMDETSESWHDRRARVQNLGRGLECGGPLVHESSSIPSNIVVDHSSGDQRSLRSKTVAPPQALSDIIDSSELSDMDTDRILSLGLNEGLDHSDVSALVGYRCTGISPEESLGGSSVSGNNSSNLDPGQISAQAVSIVDYSLGKRYEQDDERGRGTSRSSSNLSLAGRPTRPGRNWACHASRNAAVEGSVGEFYVRAPATNSFLMNQHGRSGQIHLNGSMGNFNCLSNPVIASRNTSHGTLLDGEICRRDSQLYLNSTAGDRVPDKEIPTLNGSPSRSLTSNQRSTNKHLRSSSRSSACKRKSCPSSLPVSSSCRSGSPHFSGVQESHGMRSTGGCSTARRISGTIGCMSTSDVVASASALVPRRCSETSVAASGGDEPRSRKSSLPWDGDSPGSRRAAKSPSEELTGGAFGLRDVRTSGTVGHMVQQTLSKTQPPFAQAAQRANTATERDTWCSQDDSLPNCFSNTAFVSENGEIVMQSAEQLMASNGGRKSGSQLVSSSRNGGTTSGRRSDHISSLFGERLSPRYTISSNRNMTSGASSSAVATDSRLRVRDHLNSSTEFANSFGSVVAHSRNLVSTEGVLHAGIASRSFPSRLPPHTPVVRPPQSLSSVHLSTLSSPSSGLTSSRMLPSPPRARSSFSSAMEVLPSGATIFQGSVLPRRNERAGGSDAESILGFPFPGLQLSDGEHRPRLVAEGLAEILLALDQVERDEDLTYEQLLMLEATLLFGGMGLHDQHSDLRLDVDNMSYEELLALEERIGNVSTGLTLDVVNKHLKKGRYSSQAVISAGSLESDIKCSICQEEYEEADELGEIDCGHSYHISCIRQWLIQKNVCPICKASALSS